MRLWSFHYKYLDTIGLIRAINKGMLAYRAIKGETKGYRNHPQLNRFKAELTPIMTLREYVMELVTHKTNLWYENLNQPQRLQHRIISKQIPVTIGQLCYEWQHYLHKLKTQKGRDKKLYDELKTITVPEPHPLFKVVDGDIEDWEMVKQK